jgi:O-glycosyl hydrolase
MAGYMEGLRVWYRPARATHYPGKRSRMHMRHYLIILGHVMVALCLGASAAYAADAKPKKWEMQYTDVEKAMIEKIKAGNEKATFKLARNKFCPITGKLADPKITPLDCPQMFKSLHILVAIADEEAQKVYDAAREANKSNRLSVPNKVSTAARNNMMVDTTDLKKLFIKPIVLPKELMAKMPVPKNIKLELAINAEQKFQTMDGMGTCTYPYDGRIFPVYADPEYQKMIVNDLGLSMIRFEIACDLKQVEKPEEISYKDFVIKKGATACIEFIAALKKLNPDIKVTPSVWSPPAWMKSNGNIAWGGKLKREYYPHFAWYLVEWVKFVKEKYGFDIYALSPQNELEFVEPYGSCVYSPEEYRDVVKIVGETFKKAGLNVKLFGPEDMTKFGKRTTRYIDIIEKDPAVEPFLNIHATHGYSDGIELTGSMKESSVFRDLIKEYKKPYWQTETGPGAPDERWNDGGPDGVTVRETKEGADLEKGVLGSLCARLHYSLVYGHAAGWLWWQITGSSPSVHEVMTLNQKGKKYYAFKQFCRFIRPGAVRIAAGPDGGEENVWVSAYQHEKDKTVTVVLLNRSNDNNETTINIKNSIPVKIFDSYRTSETEDCIKTEGIPVKNGKLLFTLPPRSITTLYGEVAKLSGHAPDSASPDHQGPVKNDLPLH